MSWVNTAKDDLSSVGRGGSHSEGETRFLHEPAGEHLIEGRIDAANCEFAVGEAENTVESTE